MNQEVIDTGRVSTKLSLNEIRHMLKFMRLSDVARETGTEYNALVRLANGATQEPSHSIVARVGRFLEENFTNHAE